LTALIADDTCSPDGLAAYLGQYGVSHDVIRTALAALPQVKTIVLYKPSEADAREIAVLRVMMHCAIGVVGILIIPAPAEAVAKLPRSVVKICAVPWKILNAPIP